MHHEADKQPKPAQDDHHHHDDGTGERSPDIEPPLQLPDEGDDADGGGVRISNRPPEEERE